MNHKCLLIYPPTQLMDNEIPKPDGSVGLLYLAAALENAGIPTDILDANVGTPQQTLEETLFRFEKLENGLTKVGMTFQEISDYIYKYKYDIIGINSNFTPQTRMVIETAKAIKQIPNVKVYAGGVNARFLKELLLKTGYFDGICLTDGEIIFPRVILEGIKNVPGFAYLENNKIKENPIDKSCFPLHLDELPFPTWEKIPFNKYDIRDVTDNKPQKSVAVLTSRGCIFDCDYCHNSGEYAKKLRIHSLDRIFEEVQLLKKLNINKIYLEDESLFARKKRITQLFKMVKNEGLTFLGINGVNLIHFFNGGNIDYEFIDVLKNVGFYQMAFPVESGSQRIIDRYCSSKLNLEKMDVVLLMKTLTKAGIKAPVNIIIGFPDETEKEILQSINLGKKLKDAGAIYVSFFFAIPFPGTQLYEYAVQNKYMKKIDTIEDCDKMNWKYPVMQNTIVHPEKLIELQKFANEVCNDKQFLTDIKKKTIKELKENPKIFSTFRHSVR